jgi:hypothetical protein
MELGQYQLQIFMSLVVVLGAAFVALICDFLKGNNEQLRELTIELKVRREEEQSRSQLMTAQTISPSTSVKEKMRMERSEKARIEERLETPSVDEDTAARRAVAVPATAHVTANRPEKERKRPPSADALAAMERGARLAGSPSSRRRPMPPARKPGFVTPQVVIHETVIDEAIISEIQPAGVFTKVRETVPVTVVTTEPQAAHVTLVASRRNSASKTDWGSLLARRPKMSQAMHVEVREDLLDAIVAATGSANAQAAASATVPAGFHEGFILSRLVQSRQPVSGLVVSIGVNTPPNHDGMPESVRQLMQSMIGPGDFACQSSSEEFLLIYPNERGASAQRKLSEIARQLWDFQLRSMGSFSILFSWGGVEVRSESIDEAIASANERMQETRRGRKLLTMKARGEQQAFAQAV